MPRPSSIAIPLTSLVLVLAGVDGAATDQAEMKQIEACIKTLEKTGKDSEIARWQAARSLEKLGPAAHPAIPILIRSLKSQRLGDYFISEAASDALSRIGPAAVPELRKAMKDPDPLTQILAARSYWRIDGKTDEVLPVFMRVIRDVKQDRTVATSVTRALGDIGLKDSDKVLPGLLLIVRDENETRSVRALETIVRMGPVAKRAIPDLMRVLREKTQKKPGGAAYTARVLMAGMALQNIGAESVPELIKAAGDMDPEIRHRAFWLFADEKLHRHIPTKAVPIFVDALQRGDVGVTFYAATILGGMGTRAQIAVPALAMVLEKDRSAQVRLRTVEVLVKIAAGTGQADVARKALAKALRDEDEDVRRSAAIALDQLGQKKP